MKNTILILIAAIFFIAVAQLHPEAGLPFQDYCKYFNYPVQSHVIQTEDGYLLTYFRIQKKNSTFRTGLTPILLHHGLTDSSDTWIVNDEDKAPAFILANRDFDVWLGNSRGNKHSRKHIKLNPDTDKQFWQFTFQNMSNYDLPAAFKYITAITQTKLNYLGHSQGTIIMHIALAQNNPVIQSLIDRYFGFGPVAYLTHQQSSVMKFLDRSGLIQFYHLRKIYEFLPSMNWFETDIGVIFCAQFPDICADFLINVADADPSVDNVQRYDVIVGHDPSGTSVKNMQHWKQLFDSHNFQAFDYGSKKQNQFHYGQDTAPLFNLQNVRVPMRLFAGTTDLLADVEDVDTLWSELPKNVKQFYKVYNAGHCTFLWGLDVTPWMNDLLSYF